MQWLLDTLPRCLLAHNRQRLYYTAHHWHQPGLQQQRQEQQQGQEQQQQQQMHMQQQLPVPPVLQLVPSHLLQQRSEADIRALCMALTSKVNRV